uniref:TldD/PmbA family protein n=1 Tax=candidate division WOR-3 bacterium TaxID=2052148 RepID=A0A7C4Y4N1_UNCW3
MMDFVKETIDFAKINNVKYADCRVVIIENEVIFIRNGKIEHIGKYFDKGFGVRVLVNGRWGFSASSRFSKSEIKRVVKNAIKLSKESAKVKGEEIRLSEEKPETGIYKTEYNEDPFKMKMKDKITYLMKCDKELSKVKGLTFRITHYHSKREHKFFGSTEGSFLEQEIMFTGGGIEAIAIANGDVQVRSYPNSWGNYNQGGWEYLLSLDLLGNAVKTGEEAVMLLSAEQCPSGYFDLIIEPDQLALQIHESVGHPLELDRVFGYEESYAGKSFATTEKLGNFRYGSEIVNIVADSTYPKGLGTFGWDDEGVKAQKNYLIKNGILVNYLSSRETAVKIGKKSTGAMRASSYNRIPLVRMVNVNLEPGEWEYDKLIESTDNGIILKTNRSWSIDDRRINFEFGTQIGYLVKNGKIIKPLKNCVYSGITPEFWNSCDAICNSKYYKLICLTNCGKGEPGQSMYVGHASSPARFRNVKVGF